MKFVIFFFYLPPLSVGPIRMLSLSDPADDFLPSFLYLYFLNIIYINLSLYFLCVVAVVAVVVVVVDVAGK